MTVVPLSVKAASRFTAEHHRHNLAPVGGLFATSIEDEDGDLRAVGIAARPTSRQLQQSDRFAFEISRVTSLGDPNACSQIYGRLCRAAKAIGYRRAVTYTLEDEPGTSLRAAGFEPVAEVEADDWDRRARRRVVVDLFGNDRTPPGGKVRWERRLVS